jgi:hypothetical protein
MPKLFPNVARFQPERSADRHEGEQPARVIAEKPGLGLAPSQTAKDDGGPFDHRPPPRICTSVILPLMIAPDLLALIRYSFTFTIVKIRP